MVVTQRRKLQRTAKDAVKAKELEQELNGSGKSNKKKKQKKIPSFCQNNNDISKGNKNSSDIVPSSNKKLSTPMKKRNALDSTTISSSQHSSSRSSTPKKENKVITNNAVKKSPSVRSSPRQRTKTNFYHPNNIKSKNLTSTKENLNSVHNNDGTTNNGIETKTPTSTKRKEKTKNQWQCSVCTMLNDSIKRKCAACRNPRTKTITDNDTTSAKRRRTTKLDKEEEKESSNRILCTPQEEGLNEESQDFTSSQLSPDLLLDTTSNAKKKSNEQKVARKRNIMKSSSQADASATQSQQSKEEGDRLEPPIKSKLNHEDSDSESSCILELEEKSPFAGKGKITTTVNNKDTSTLSTNNESKEDNDESQPKESNITPFTSSRPTLPTNKSKEEESQLTESHTNPFILNTPSTISTIPLPLLSQDDNNGSKKGMEEETACTSPTQQQQHDAVELKRHCKILSPSSSASVPISNITKKKEEEIKDKPTTRTLTFTPKTADERELHTNSVIVEPTPQSTISPPTSSIQTKTDKQTCSSVQSTTTTLPSILPAQQTTPTIIYQLTPLKSSTTTQTTPTYNNNSNTNISKQQSRQTKLIQDLTTIISDYTKETDAEHMHLQQLVQIQKRQIASLAMKFEEEKTKRMELEQCILSWWKNEKTNSSSMPNWMKNIVDVTSEQQNNIEREELSEEVSSEDNTNSQIRSIAASAAAQFRPSAEIIDEKDKKEQRKSTTLKGWNRNSKEGMSNFTDIPVTTATSTPTPKKKVIINPYAKKQKQCTSDNDQQCNTTECKPQQQQSYKYQQVIRNKDIRRGLPGHDCEHCRDFINAVCGQGGTIDRQAFLNNCSKHKCEFSPDPTPDGFWELSFADSLRNRDA